MFARLKEKIQKEAGNVSDGERPLSSLPGHASPRRSSNTSSPSSPLSKDRPQVDSDSASEEPMPKMENMTKEEILVMLQKRTKKCMKFEHQITECVTVIRDKNRAIEKMETCIEKQQDAAAKRAQELNEQYQAKRVSLSDGFKSEMEKKDTEKQEILDKLRELQGMQQKYSKMEEEKEELEGFTNQELGKVKHLLILSQQELSTCKEELTEKAGLLDAEEKKNREFEDHLSAESHKATSLQVQRDQYKTESMDNAKLISALTKERMTLEGQLIELRAELSEKQSRISSLQSKYTDLENSHQALVRNTDVHKNKLTQQLQERADSIEELQERVHTLEHREHAHTLSGDDRVRALETERELLEKKLSETREQLSQIKSSWSDKISHLEDQISHLNRKIVEDNEELEQSQNTTETVRENFLKEIESLKESVRQSEKRTAEQIQLVKDRDIQTDRLRRDLEAQVHKVKMEKVDIDTQLRATIASLESQLLSLETAKLHEKSALEDQILRYVNQEKDGIEKLVKCERKVEELEEANTKLQVAVVNQEKLCENLKHEIKQITDSHTEKTAQVEKLQGELGNLRTKLETTQQNSKSKSTEIITSTKENDELMLRNAELSQQLTGLQQSVNDDRRALEDDLLQRAETEQELRHKYAEMEQHSVHMERKVEELQLAQSHQQDSCVQAEQLQETIASLEDQLVDKNRVLKKQEQRLSDLKKTLQRELKVQSLPNDEPLDGKISMTPPLARKNSLNRTSHHQDTKSRTRRETSRERSPVSHDTSQEGYDRLSQNSYGIPRLTGHHTSHGLGVPPHIHGAGNSLGHGQTFSRERDINSDGDLSALFHSNSGHSRSYSSKEWDVRHLEKDVNFQYLKHVVMKFMLSRESEAIHLIKAVSLLLRFTPEEQKLMKDTIEWKMSWFGGSQPPAVLKGQTNKIIPPSY